MQFMTKLSWSSFVRSDFCFVSFLSFTAPNFVSSFTQGDFVYFFFRETAVEFINCGKVSATNRMRIYKIWICWQNPKLISIHNKCGYNWTDWTRQEVRAQERKWLYRRHVGRPFCLCLLYAYTLPARARARAWVLALVQRPNTVIGFGFCRLFVYGQRLLVFY